MGFCFAGGKGRLALAFFFGLFHGLGFAGGLLGLLHAMPTQMVGYAIVGSSIGVEVGNQLVLLPLYGVWQRIKRFKTEPLKPKRLLMLQRLALAVIAIAGVYYLYVALATTI